MVLRVASSCIRDRLSSSVWLLVNHTIGALAPWFWHLSSILLHAPVRWAVFKLGLLLLQSPEAAAFAALLFALHPVHIESVCWFSASNELLRRFSFSPDLGMGSVQVRKYVLLGGVALLTKETAVALLPVFPMMAFLEDRVRSRWEIGHWERSVSASRPCSESRRGKRRALEKNAPRRKNRSRILSETSSFGHTIRASPAKHSECVELRN